MRKEVGVRLFPRGTTVQFQPLDVHGFRPWKELAHRISDMALIDVYDKQLNNREGIITLQNLLHNWLSSPRFQPLWQIGWYQCI
jgi:hypothetical protein